MPVASLIVEVHYSLFSKDSCVVVEGKRQMILYEVFARGPEVERIPVLELSPHALQDIQGYRRVGNRSLQKDVVPNLGGTNSWCSQLSQFNAAFSFPKPYLS
jgi:hypothetical protein